MDNRYTKIFNNILLTYQKSHGERYDLLYISSEIRQLTQEGERFYERNYFDKHFPSIPYPAFQFFFEQLGKGEKLHLPMLVNSSRFTMVKVEGYVISQGEDNYLVNVLLSPEEWGNHVKLAWLINQEDDKIYEGTSWDKNLFHVEEWYAFILQQFPFLTKESLVSFREDAANDKLAIFPGHLYLSKRSLGNHFFLVQLEYHDAKILEENEDFLEKRQDLVYYEYLPRENRFEWTGNIHELLGYGPEYFSNFSLEDWTKLVHPDDRQIQRMGMEQGQKVVYRVLHQQGHFVFLEDYVKRFDSKSRKKPLILGTISDITALKEIEKELMDHKSVLDELTGVVPGMVYMLKSMPDLNHKFLFVSEGAYQLFEISSDKILESRKHLEEIIHPEDIQRLLEADRIAYETDSKFECYFRVITPSGKTKWIYGASNRLKKYKEDSIWAGFFVDVTYTKEKELESEVLFKRYKALFDENPLPVFQYDKEGIIKDVNKSFLEKIDLHDPKILIGRNMYTLVGNNPIKEAYKNAITKGHGYYEGPYVSHFNQKLFHLRATAKPIGDGENYQAILEDISEDQYVHHILSKVTGKTSRYSGLDFFEKLTKFLSEDLLMSDCFIARVDEENQMAHVLTGVSEGKKMTPFSYSLEDTPCLNCLHNKNPLVIQKGVYKLYPLDKILVERNTEAYLGVPIVSLEGKTLGILALLNGQTKVFGAWIKTLLSVLADRIGAEMQRMDSENKLKASEQLYRLIAQNFPKGTIEVIDKNFMYLFAEGKEFQEKNIDPKNLIGTPHMAKYNGYASKKIRERLDKALKGDAVMFEIVEDDQYYLKSAVPLRDTQGIINSMLLVSQNITETKLAEEEREKLIRDLKSQNEELQRFAYIISHNLRAPIVNISSLLELYNSSDPQDPENEDIIENLRLSTDILQDTLKDLIEVVSIKKDKLPKVETIQFDDLINRIERSLYNQIKDSHTVIMRDFTNAPSINYIFSHMENFLMNLTTNAMKYKHPDRQPVISIRTRQENDYVVLEFKDNGIGMDLERYGDRVFGLYQRFHSHVEGKGLGLYLVKEQLRAHDGNIYLDSKAGEGSTFTIYMKNLKVITMDEKVNSF